MDSVTPVGARINTYGMGMSTKLRPALSGDKSSLSKQALGEIIKLSGARPAAFISQSLLAWAIIFATIAIATHTNTMWMSIIAVVIIATRMNVLGLLVHEQVHALGLRGKYGDTFANLMTAYPLLGITVEDYAKVHLSHHKHYFTESDPDFLRKIGRDWSFPMQRTRLAKLFLSDLIGLSFIKLVAGKRGHDIDAFVRPNPTAGWIRPAFFVLIAVLLTLVGAWKIFLLYWILPLTTVLVAIVRLGSIYEHIYNIPRAGVIESSPLIVPTWYERVLLPNLNFTLHPYHHFFPGISWSNLPTVHEIFRREGLVNDKNVFNGNYSYLKFLQSRG